MKVFISHTFSKEDLDLAEKLEQILSKAGIDGYLAERKPKYNKLIRDKIIAEIRKSDHMIAILTENSSDSASVNQELGYALREGISPIIMREKNAKQGVLIFGLDTEVFTKDIFLDSCKKVLNHIENEGTRERIPEEVSEVLKRVVKLESKLVNPSSQSTIDYSYRNPEDQWFNEIMKFCDVNEKNLDAINEGAIPDSDVLRSHVKEYYSKIQMLRQEIKEISESYDKAATFARPRLAEILSKKRAELKDLLENLRDNWKMYSD